jgi:hypothetical protein
MVTIGQKRAFRKRKAKAVNLSKLLVPEVGIPSVIENSKVVLEPTLYISGEEG